MKRTTLLLLALFIALGVGFAGFQSKTSKGEKLTAGEKAAMNCAINEIDKMADGMPAILKAKLKELAKCLKDALAKGRICADRAKGDKLKINGICRPDGCGWKDDRLNFRADWLVKTEPTFSKLVAVTVHEGIHALQWIDGAGGITDNVRAVAEWEAYTWQKYILLKRLKMKLDSDPTKDKQIKDGIKKELERVCGWMKHYCSKVDKLRKSRASGAKSPRSKSGLKDANLVYVSSFPNDGNISIIDLTTNQTVRTLNSGHLFTTDMCVFTSPQGDDVLYTAGISDPNDIQGGISVMTDADNDGLLDQGTLNFLVPPGNMGLPLHLTCDEDQGDLYALEMDPGDNLLVRIARDNNSDGLPDNMQPQPYADSGMFPELNEAFVIGFELPSQIVFSQRQDGMDYEEKTMPVFELFDQNNDGLADGINGGPFNQFSLQPMAPSFLTDLQHQDDLVAIDVYMGADYEIWATDSTGTNLLELLAGGTGANPDFLEIVPLSRPLLQGEFLMAFDTTHGLQLELPTEVIPLRPEIFLIDLTDALPGQPVRLDGRNFLPQPDVLCSGVPAQVVNFSDSFIEFLAPPVFQIPTGQVVVQVSNDQGLSDSVGLRINADCNNNGTADSDDIMDGTSQDQNANNIPDECECGPDPVVYCTAKVNSCGGEPAMEFLGFASASANSGFFVSGNKARANKPGFMLYTNNGRANFPFQGGLLCVSPPLRRTVPTVSVGGGPGVCESTFITDMNEFASGNGGGNPAPFLSQPGTQVNCQYWGRDTVANGSYLSDALEYIVCQ